ncbi:MAG: hypothetical protein HY785_27865 [Oscillatoriophycideae cyanobacterium NC_groundwater_1537_Pr4_S-0.65um_50_18]|nr:hypothetical protein [Oscillatoriophycideae cyanobacterium NC_groundwater_1537_Pr4_S-0.65um_50_18]
MPLLDRSLLDGFYSGQNGSAIAGCKGAIRIDIGVVGQKLFARQAQSGNPRQQQKEL